MTEAEWLACGDPKQMLEFLRGKASERKLRLFACACACCRRLWRFLDERSREALEDIEKSADGPRGNSESMLLFGTINQNTPDSVTIHNHQGIFLSPQQAKALANVLNQNVSQYEATFGEIRLEPKPPAPGMPATAKALSL